MVRRSFFFAGGGTGGHIYPAVAVAEQILRLDHEPKIHFFCSQRLLDYLILPYVGFAASRLPARGFSIKPLKLAGFCISFIMSYRIAKQMLAASENPVVVGIGGFVAAPVCFAAHRLKLPVALINVDILPGRANRVIGRFADEIFVQFEDTMECFRKSRAKVSVVGCPLRASFAQPQPARAMEELGLDKDKKVLLITGASSGAENINRAVCGLLDKLSVFADTWQIVHLTGMPNLERVRQAYDGAKIAHKVVGYYNEMANLLSAADLVIGRSGAVSVAEYAAAGVPSICMPYPYHKDRHQYFNAGKLVEAGAAVIVDDLPDEHERAEWLWEELEELMKDDEKRSEMRTNCKAVAKVDAAAVIARKLLNA
ncbi:MAG TPA: UDP-N-acetylglucosamine--N-acetylmuramyl-(pentapeptide) pyrophosphoryl-undecaprenol N-acetylglucosamine transferase [Sedimentisphaerales bacterium]|nr:UDP-N-acetylglucosamine--N-acetylmuramyl-(pentapeptide) pyrophosphoryl-undecaprenol N-acetylglucosamine transferase [Sedimentisphaerales bacterium]